MTAAYLCVLSLILSAGLSTFSSSILVPHGLITKLVALTMLHHSTGWRATIDIAAIICISLLMRAAMTVREEIIYISASVSPMYVISSADMSTYTELDAVLCYLLLSSILIGTSERSPSSLYA